MLKRRKFSAEFKRGAVDQVRNSGVSCAQIARELGIRDGLLTRWKRELDGEGPVALQRQWGTARSMRTAVVYSARREFTRTPSIRAKRLV